jgi:hypothetical protein
MLFVICSNLIMFEFISFEFFVHSGVWLHIDETNFNIFYECDLFIYFIFIDHYRLDNEC